MSKIETDRHEPPRKYEPHDEQHSPIVLYQQKKRAGDWQLRLADRITASAGSMTFVWVHVRDFHRVGCDRPLWRRWLPV